MGDLWSNGWVIVSADFVKFIIFIYWKRPREKTSQSLPVTSHVYSQTDIVHRDGRQDDAAVAHNPTFILLHIYDLFAASPLNSFTGPNQNRTTQLSYIKHKVFRQKSDNHPNITPTVVQTSLRMIFFPLVLICSR